MAKFVQGSCGHTSHIRVSSIDINLDAEHGAKQRLGITLIDTPSLDFKDEAGSERLLAETIRHIDTRFAEGVEDVSALYPPRCVNLLTRSQEWRAQYGDRYVHLCVF